MPALQITNSLNIASLDSKILANLCTGIFSVDLSPSIWVGTGYNNVRGASVKIVNPYGVSIKDYPTSGYDIYSPMSSNVNVSVPTQASNYQYGTYIVTIKITDANGAIYTVEKQVSICAPDVLNKTRNYGSLSAQVNGVCKDGKVYIIADNVPVYKGTISDTQVNAFTLEYPTSSGISLLNTVIGNFSTYLFEGVYKFTGTICANYNFGDNVSAKVNYKLKKEKNIRCLLDETCIYARLAQLDAQTKSDCTNAEKQETQDIIVNALRLLKTIEVSATAGFDAGEYIDELETLLGCTCTCNCADGTPIINRTPAKDLSITGCNVEKTTVGLTDTYVINNFSYVVAVTDNGGALTVSAPILNNCAYTQTFTFSIAVIYAQVKNQIVNTTEYNFWASIISKTWDTLNINCLGVTQSQWDLATYAQRMQYVISAICSGGSCAGAITSFASSNSANNATVSWVNNSSVYEVDVYVNNIFSGSVLYPNNSFLINGAADGTLHNITLIPRCSNGSAGVGLIGSFTYYGCPAIATPTVTSNSVSGATCPYNLTALVTGLPVGITAEWHSLNNTNSSSLVPAPTTVSDGTYFVFGKDSNGCYSLAAQVIIVCSSTTNCSAPQTLLVEYITGGNRVRFQSAAFPPPLNSYTVKRRLSADPDVSGSYTAIGTPTWNSTVNRWEILDAGATNNTLYTYRAISNCTSTAPYQDYQFANLTCPAVTLAPAETTMGYSFTGVGGSVDKYEVKIYSSDGISLIHTDTKLPAFSSPITGTFTYLTAGTVYNVRVRVYIGTYYIDCAFTTAQTTYNYTLSAAYNLAISSVTGTGVPSLPATAVNGPAYGHHTVISGTLAITLAGTVITTTKVSVIIDGVVYSCAAVPSAGVYNLACVATALQDVRISIGGGTC